MGKHEELQKKTASRTMVAVALCAVVLLVIGMGTVVARYITNWQTGYGSIAASEFYFTSDLLGEESENKTYSLVYANLDEAVIEFNLFNYQDELNISKKDIAYTIEYKLNDKTKTQNGTIKEGAGETPIKYSLASLFGVNAYAHQARVEVTARSTAPFEKTLKATFILTESANEPKLSVVDAAGSNAGTVTITTGAVGGQVTVTMPTGCIPDPTNSLIAATTTKVNNNTVTFTAGTDAEYSFAYLKTTPANSYTVDQFSINTVVSK